MTFHPVYLFNPEEEIHPGLEKNVLRDLTHQKLVTKCDYIKVVK